MEVSVQHCDNHDSGHGCQRLPVAVADSAIAVEAGGVANGTAGTNPTGNVLTNDTDADAGDTKTVIGVAAGTLANASGSVGSSINGSYGAIMLNADGSYSYVVNNSLSAVQALRTASDTLTDVFTYTLSDAVGVNSTTQVTITIQGANDSPFDLSATGMTIDENLANGQPVGQVTTSDVDSNESFLYALSQDADGRFSIDPNTGLISVADASRINRELAASHNVTVQVTDAAGGTFSKQFTIS